MTEGERIERDSLGEVKVPADKLYGAQTQRALKNFSISDLVMPSDFIHAMGLIKLCAARVNTSLGVLNEDIGRAIEQAAEEVASGRHDDQFPVDVFQTGSGTSTNMNVNEVIATLAQQNCSQTVHPNDHVNLGQSSNDVIPTALHVSAALKLAKDLLPTLQELQHTIEQRADELADVVKVGRTHLMDAMPVTLGQELSGWSAQIAQAGERIQSVWPRLLQLAQGGTAVGTGINSEPEFAERFCAEINEQTGFAFRPAGNTFSAVSCQDTVVELSGQLRGLATTLLKIANDLRWMNSGPHAGLAEIQLPALQPGSSIMPGKVNPVIPEAVAMACMQVIGNDTTTALAGQAGNFQLNVGLPVMAYNLLQSIALLTSSVASLGQQAIAGFTVNREQLAARLEDNPMLATALTRWIGYDRAAEIAHRAFLENRQVVDVAEEMTDIPHHELVRLLDPLRLTGQSSD